MHLLRVGEVVRDIAPRPRHEQEHERREPEHGDEDRAVREVVLAERRGCGHDEQDRAEHEQRGGDRQRQPERPADVCVGVPQHPLDAGGGRFLGRRGHLPGP
jgi:hypothetical protein